MVDDVFVGAHEIVYYPTRIKMCNVNLVGERTAHRLMCFQALTTTVTLKFTDTFDYSKKPGSKIHNPGAL